MYWGLLFASERYVALSDLAELQRIKSVKFALNAKANEELCESFVNLGFVIL